MKLTAAIAAMYYGCNLECAPYADADRLIIGKMVGLNEFICDVKFPEWQSVAAVAYEHCKLILRPLSEITDEDAMEVSKIFGHNYPSEENGKRLLDCFHSWGKWGCDSNETTLYDGKRVSDYLRSKSYDCDNLISNGIAITKQN